MNRLRREQKWNRRLVWEYDPRLVPLWKRVGALTNTKVRWQRIRDGFAAFVTLHDVEVAGAVDEYIELDWAEWGEAAGLERRWRRIVMGALVTARLAETREGLYRPNPDVRDHKTGWENAKHILSKLPAHGQTARKMVQTAREVVQTAHPENAAKVGRLPTGIRARPGEIRSKTNGLPSQNVVSGNGGTRHRLDTATVTNLNPLDLAPRQSPDPTGGTDSPAAPPPLGGSGSGDPYTQDDGPCADCGAELPGHVVDAIRGARLDPNTPREWKRWSHRSIDGVCP